MKTNPRTLLAIALFVPLAAILLATFACLPVPIGDPEKSKVDETLSGVYQGKPTEPGDKTLSLAILRPWDAKTYLLQYFVVDASDNKDKRQFQSFKCWLTTIEGKTFLTAQPMGDLQFALGDKGDKPVWVVFRLDIVPSGLVASMVNPDSEFLKDLAKPEDFAAAIKAHVSDKGLYGDAVTFKKLGKDDQALIDDVLGKFNAK
jgi:hypothetical protein